MTSPKLTIYSLAALFALGILVSSTRSVWGHQLGESYVFLSASETRLSGRLEIALTDLNKVIPMDADNDGQLTEAEWNAVAERAKAYLQPRLMFRVDQIEYPPTLTNVAMRDLPMIDKFALLSFDVPNLSSVPEEIDAYFRFLFDEVEPNHRTLLVIENNTRTGTKDNERVASVMFGSGDEWQTVSFLKTPLRKVLWMFIQLGAWHIWIGHDHILFIVALLLPSVLRRDDGKWCPVEGFSEAAWNVVKVVTLFTVAHSVTLTLASLRLITIPSSIVESIIALSIAVTALNNIKPWFSDKIWIVVFVFGLFHGFGFASVLEPLGVMTSNLTLALFGFNVGVEVGQIAIVGVVFPLLYLLRKTVFYQPIILRFGSGLLIIMAMIWFVDRAGHVWQRAQERGLL